MKKRTQELIELQKLITAFSAVNRIMHHPVPRPEQAENDVEHSYSLAMAAWLLSQDYPELDRDLLIRYALVHDLVEVYAGDVLFERDANQEAQKIKDERAALARLQSEWSSAFPELLETLEHYELLQDPESRFIYALDKIMPVTLNILTKGFTWRKINLSAVRHDKAKREKIAKSPEMLEVYDDLCTHLEQHPEYFAS